MRNKYIKHGKFYDEKIRDVVRRFFHDIEVTNVSLLTRINRVTINRIFKVIRIYIAENCEQESLFADGKIEIDESDFGARWTQSVSGCGARGKKIVFKLIKRKGKVYTQIVETRTRKNFIQIIKTCVSE